MLYANDTQVYKSCNVNDMDSAKTKNFDVKATSGGFVFIPLKDEGNEMSEI